jgi:hypothetical protein
MGRKHIVEEVTREITSGGGRAEAATVNALDDAAVNEYLDRIVSRTGRIDAVSMPQDLWPGSMGTENMPWI